LVKKCQGRNCVPMLDREELDLKKWNRMSFGAYSIISFKCCKCSITEQKTLSDFVRCKNIHCLCNTRLRRQTPKRYEEFLRLCDDRNCDLEISLNEWLRKAKSKNFKVPICCKKCGIVAESTSISKFVNNGRSFHRSDRA